MDEDPGRCNVRQAVPFFHVFDMEKSVRFYVDGLGFRILNQWGPEGELQWCWLELGQAAIMLQVEGKDQHFSEAPQVERGLGISISFQCEDALAIYQAAVGHGLEASRPFVGNNMWLTTMSDPDGFRLEFHSPTDAPEETVYGEP